MFPDGYGWLAGRDDDVRRMHPREGQSQCGSSRHGHVPGSGMLRTSGNQKVGFQQSRAVCYSGAPGGCSWAGDDVRSKARRRRPLADPCPCSPHKVGNAGKCLEMRRPIHARNLDCAPSGGARLRSTRYVESPAPWCEGGRRNTWIGTLYGVTAFDRAPRM